MFIIIDSSTTNEGVHEMQYEIVDCSPKAKTKIKSEEDKYGMKTSLTHQRSKYPWPLLQIGKSFIVPFAEGNESSLRNGAASYAKKSAKKFAVIRHNEFSCFEVVRIK